MKHIKNLTDFLNESTINESSTEFISDPKFKNQTTLTADILKNAGPALEKFLKERGINWPGKIEISILSNRLSVQANKLIGKELGVMQYGFKEVELELSGTGNDMPRTRIPASGDFEFTSSIWTTICYRITHGSENAGFNANAPRPVSPLYLPGNTIGSLGGDICYDIVNGVWLDRKAAQKAGF